MLLLLLLLLLMALAAAANLVCCFARPQAIVFWNDKEIGRTPVFEDSCNPEFKAKFAVVVPLSEVNQNTLRVELFDFGPQDHPPIALRCRMSPFNHLGARC